MTLSLIEQFTPSEVVEFLDDPSPLSHKAQARQARRAAKTKQSSLSKPLVAKTPKQAEYLSLLDAGEDCFAVGGAGTGKTYIAARKAARALIEGRVEKIIIARVTVAKAKHALGFLPGKLEQKLAPWLIPVFDGLKAEVSGHTLDQWRTDGKVEIASFEHMRGRTFSNAFVLLDEAQNADRGDLRLFLTRIGEDSQVVVTGDLDQIDIHNSGLEEVIDLVERYGIPMQVVRFGSADVVRSAIARAFVQAFEADGLHRSHPPRDQILDAGPDIASVGFMQPAAGRA